MVDVTIMAWIYGENYDQYLDRWSKAINDLETKPARVIVCSDKPRQIDVAEVLHKPVESNWQVPNPHYANFICNYTDTEWMLLMDIDDQIKPDCLNELDQVSSDVWLMGIDINGQEKYLPAQMSNESIASDPNCYFCFGSPFRKHWALDYPFVESPYTDWIFWRQIARAGAKFEWSNKIGYTYRKDFANSMSGWANANPKWREEALSL
jgi:hypothetical protein